MAGAYCTYCGQRCFVYRQVTVGGALVWAGHMATCSGGAAHDRRSLGVDFTSAVNPQAVCGATTRRFDFELRCELARGHEDSHRNGSCRWRREG
jgi:hypothetical protein